MTFRPDAFVTAAVMCACGAAPAASLQGVFTADDLATVYLSTDLMAEAGEVIVDKATTWQTVASFADVTLAPGQDHYLLFSVRNSFGGMAMLIGDFSLGGTGFTFANGATTLMFEGVPTYPDVGRFWQVCEKHKVNQFYTAPTAIRALMRHGPEPVERFDLSSLKLLGSVGEPINPEAWEWYNEVVGKGKCPIVDTWWQTETGGHMLTTLPGAHPAKPGAACKPFFGVQPVVLDSQTGKEIDETECEGVLCVKDAWPGILRSVYGDHDRFVQTYFSDYKGYYFSGDGCRRDADGDYWITGRVDDVINVSGHRMGTAEVESALVAHSKVAEAAVVGFPHALKGQGIYCYVTLMEGEAYTDELREELVAWVRKEIGPIAKPDVIQWAPGLPKTRSGKIMRRILRKIAENDFGSLGDTSTLADPGVVEELIENRPAT